MARTCPVENVKSKFYHKVFKTSECFHEHVRSKCDGLEFNTQHVYLPATDKMDSIQWDERFRVRSIQMRWIGHQYLWAALEKKVDEMDITMRPSPPSKVHAKTDTPTCLRRTKMAADPNAMDVLRTCQPRSSTNQAIYVTALPKRL
jgi:hypothetical protein